MSSQVQDLLVTHFLVLLIYKDFFSRFYVNPIFKIRFT